MDVEKISIGICIGITIWYLKSCYDTVYKRKVIANKLNAYLLNIRRELERESIYISFMNLGERLHKRKRSDKKKGKDFFVQKIPQYEFQIKRLCIFITKKIVNSNLTKELKVNMEELEDITNSDSGMSLLKNQINEKIKWMVEGKTFITDDEASILGPYPTIWTAAIKSSFIYVTDDVLFLIPFLLKEPVDEKKLRTQLYSFCSHAVELSEAFSRLNEISEVMMDEPILTAMIREIFKSSRHY